jgi:hypothetical protein
MTYLGEWGKSEKIVMFFLPVKENSIAYHLTCASILYFPLLFYQSHFCLQRVKEVFAFNHAQSLKVVPVNINYMKACLATAQRGREEYL